MKYILLIFSLFAISGCADNNDESKISVSTNRNIENKIPVVSSLDFIRKLYSANIKKDNFYPKDKTNYEVTITNLIPISYSIGENETNLYCIAYSSENNECYYPNSGYAEVAIKVGDSIIKVGRTMNDYFYTFKIKLSNPQDIKSLKIYNPSSKGLEFDNRLKLSYANENKSFGLNSGSSVIYYVEETIMVTGTYEGNDHGYNTQNINFENCTFKVTNSFKVSQKEMEHRSGSLYELYHQ